VADVAKKEKIALLPRRIIDLSQADQRVPVQ